MTKCILNVTQTTISRFDIDRLTNVGINVDQNHVFLFIYKVSEICNTLFASSTKICIENINWPLLFDIHHTHRI